jgi:outer membrane protein assembly factor BamB
MINTRIKFKRSRRPKRSGYVVACLGSLLSLSLDAQQTFTIAQFRGANHSGIFEEKNLLKKWPADGPALLWSYETLGNGYGSPAVTEDRVFVQGETDGSATIFSFDLKGNLLWKRVFGEEYISGNYSGSLSTPTVVDDLLYSLSGMGDIACLKTSTGEKVWGVNMIRDLRGDSVPYGFSQSLLVNGDIVYCAPSGKQNNFVALDRFTGKVIWTCSALGEGARCSPILLERSGRKIIVSTSSSSVLGIDGKTGEFLWSYVVDSTENTHYNTPLFDGEYLYCFSFFNGKGVVKLRLSADGSQVSEIWKTQNLLNSIGGVVKAGDYLVASHQNNLISLDVRSGVVCDSIPSGSGWGGVTIFADGMIYLYNGRVLLVSIQSGKMKEISKFVVNKGTKFHFAHPSLKNGVLYIRHGNALMAYSISS